MAETIEGTFHFHSTYSHDGRNTLAEIASSLQKTGLSFCVMTEHFEDFDAAKFARYLGEAKAVTRETGFLFIPGIEVHLSGVDTIVIPAEEFDSIERLASAGEDRNPALYKIVAHPSKYPFDKIVRHLERYQIHGIELWNQQADGSHIPPLPFLERVGGMAWRHQYQYFFGCDLHSASLTVANVLAVAKPAELSADAVLGALREGNFVSRNLMTGVEYRNGAGGTDFDAWLKAIQQKSYYRGRVLRQVRRCLRSAFKKLPRGTQHALNDVKNFVRNKV